MYRITGTIEGISPLLFSRPYKIIEGVPPGSMTDEAREQEAFKRLHRDERGVYIPMEAFEHVVIDGAKGAGIKDGKKSVAPLMKACLFPQHHLYLGKETFDEKFPTWARVPPRTGSAVMITYPLFRTGWSADFTLLQVQDNRALNEKVRAALDYGGMYVGLGSWRPKHGRFRVTAWDAVDIGKG